MNEIIKITEHEGRKVVSARELHYSLESKQKFANWIKNRISKYGLVENEDFVVINNLIKNLSGGRPQIEYALSLDASKELSMVEGRIEKFGFEEHVDFTTILLKSTVGRPSIEYALTPDVAKELLMVDGGNFKLHSLIILFGG